MALPPNIYSHTAAPSKYPVQVKFNEEGEEDILVVTYTQQNLFWAVSSPEEWLAAAVHHPRSRSSSVDLVKGTDWILTKDTCLFACLGYYNLEILPWILIGKSCTGL